MDQSNDLKFILMASDLRTIVFPIDLEYKSDDSPLEDSYLTIGSSENKTYHLRRICSNEPRTIRQYKRGKFEEDPLFQKYSNVILKTGIVASLSTGDVYDMDWDAFHPDNKYNCVMLLKGDRYIGHVYCWESNDILKMQGIRSSIENLLSKEVRGVAPLLVDQVIRFGKELGKSRIQVIEPIHKMPEILKSLGFSPMIDQKRFEYDDDDGNIQLESGWDVPKGGEDWVFDI